MVTDNEIVEKAEAMCEQFSNLLGRQSTGFAPPFHKSTNPRRQLMWRLVAIAFAELTATDIDDSVANCEEDF